MIENNYIISQTELYFLAKKTEKQNIENSNEEILMADENFAQLKYELKACIFDLQKAKFLNNENKVVELTKKQAKLKEALHKVQSNLNFTLKSYSPYCKLCNDDGMINGSYCKCFYEKLNELAYDFLELPMPKLFSFEQDSGNTENKILIAKMKRYAENFSTKTSPNLFITGKRGTGKTFVSQAIAEYLNKNNFNVLFFNSFQLNNLYFKMLKASFKDKLIYEEILTKSDLLIIDDLGIENVVNGITAENLLMIISQRLEYHKPFIVTTNLAPNEIRVKYDERIFSRMCGKNSVIVEFKGKDQRFNN